MHGHEILEMESDGKCTTLTIILAFLIAEWMDNARRTTTDSPQPHLAYMSTNVAPVTPKMPLNDNIPLSKFSDNGRRTNADDFAMKGKLNKFFGTFLEGCRGRYRRHLNDGFVIVFLGDHVGCRCHGVG